MDAQSPSNELVFGLTEEGNAIWDTNLHANVFILGDESSLPNITRNLFTHCLTHNSEWQFYGIDLSQRDTIKYRKFNETVSSIANTLDDGIKMIDGLVTEMNTRYSLMDSQNVNTYSKLENPERKILFVLDWAGLFMHQLLSISRSFRSQFLEKFTTLLQLGQAVGIHVVLSTQRMDVVLFPEAMRSHFAVRIATEKIDTTPSAILFGTNVGTRLPKDLKGRGLFVIAGEEKVFQGFYSDFQVLFDWVIKDEGKAEPDLYQTLKM
jgi:hypothetical protein